MCKARRQDRGLEDDVVEPEMVGHIALASVIPITSGKTSAVSLTVAISGVIVSFSFGMGYFCCRSSFRSFSQ